MPNIATMKLLLIAACFLLVLSCIECGSVTPQCMEPISCTTSYVNLLSQMVASSSDFNGNVLTNGALYASILSYRPYVPNDQTSFLATTEIGSNGYVWINNNGTIPCSALLSGIPPFEFKQTIPQAYKLPKDGTIVLDLNATLVASVCTGTVFALVSVDDTDSSVQFSVTVYYEDLSFASRVVTIAPVFASTPSCYGEICRGEVNLNTLDYFGIPQGPAHLSVLAIPSERAIQRIQFTVADNSSTGFETVTLYSIVGVASSVTDTKGAPVMDPGISPTMFEGSAPSMIATAEPLIDLTPNPPLGAVSPPALVIVPSPTPTGVPPTFVLTPTPFGMTFPPVGATPDTMGHAPSGAQAVSPASQVGPAALQTPASSQQSPPAESVPISGTPHGVPTASPDAAAPVGPVGCGNIGSFTTGNISCGDNGQVVVNGTLAVPQNAVVTIQLTQTAAPAVVVDGCVQISSQSNVSVYLNAETTNSILNNQTKSLELIRSQAGCLNGAFSNAEAICSDPSLCSQQCMRADQSSTSTSLTLLFTVGCESNLTTGDNGIPWWGTLVAILAAFLVVAIILVVVLSNKKIRRALFPFADRREKAQASPLD